MRGIYEILTISMRSMACVILLAGGSAAYGKCPQFSAGHKTGTIESPRINEASGIAASRKNPGVLWVHNDDGQACVYAMTQEGKHLGTYNLAGAHMRDWEDIAVGPGQEPNIDYLYIGDIGDNMETRKSIAIYRVAEPNVDINQPAANVTIEGVETIVLVYPDGPHNAETLMADPLTKDLYIITKEGLSRIYRSSYPQSTTEQTTLEYVGNLPWGMATGGDISPDGQMMIVRGYFAASVWMRPREGPLWKAFEGEECNVPLIVESQGEAICFDANGTGYYTTSENRRQPIYYFPKKE
jgi:hypothetical protein